MAKADVRAIEQAALDAAVEACFASADYAGIVLLSQALREPRTYGITATIRFGS